MPDPTLDVQEFAQPTLVVQVQQGGGAMQSFATTLPPLFRGLGMLLALDAVVGLWLALHAPGALSVYLTPQVPLIGIGGLLWGFLPDTEKRKFGDWLADRLARRRLFLGLLVIGSSGIVTSLFVTSVAVRSVDPQVSTAITMMAGRREQSDQLVTADRDRKRLNRLTTPLRWYVFLSPVGRTLWFYSDTHVLTQNRRAKPWLPVVVDYPDDFQELSTLAVLPDDTTMDKLSGAGAVFRLRDRENPDVLIAEGTLADHGVFVAFTRPLVADAELHTRWRNWLLNQSHADSSLVTAVLARWLAADWPAEQTWIRARQPLYAGQQLTWEILAHGQRLAGGDVAVTERMMDIHVTY